jgi:hypothetical protein
MEMSGLSLPFSYTTRAARTLALWLLVAAGDALPVKDRTPYPYVHSSLAGRAYFKMLPDSEDKGLGTAFRVTGGPADDVLWTVTGWYSFATYISDDGRHLVRVEGSPGGGPLVAFYDRGKSIAEHSVADLINDPEVTLQAGSHPSYTLSERREIGSDFSFRLTTAERVEYTFDVRTGAIIQRRKLE